MLWCFLSTKSFDLLIIFGWRMEISSLSYQSRARSCDPIPRDKLCITWYLHVPLFKPPGPALVMGGAAATCVSST